MNTRNIAFKSNKVCDIVEQYHTVLDGLYGKGEVDCFVWMLFEAFLGWDRTTFLLNNNSTIDQSDLLKMHWALVDLQAFRPIQHIIGQVEFCGCTIAVNQHVLIPRPETAQLVDMIVRENANPGSIIDLCTGSGCLAIALKKSFQNCAVAAVDISERALDVARSNAEKNGTDVVFKQTDVLCIGENLGNERYDIIVSNPPYVLSSEKKTMQPNVLNYEPHEALFVKDEDALCFYRAIAEFAMSHLTPSGRLYFEINAKLAEETLHEVQRHGLQAMVVKDVFEKDRFIKAWL